MKNLFRLEDYSLSNLQLIGRRGIVGTLISLSVGFTILPANAQISENLGFDIINEVPANQRKDIYFDIKEDDKNTIRSNVSFGADDNGLSPERVAMMFAETLNDLVANSASVTGSSIVMSKKIKEISLRSGTSNNFVRDFTETVRSRTAGLFKISPDPDTLITGKSEI